MAEGAEPVVKIFVVLACLIAGVIFGTYDFTHDEQVLGTIMILILAGLIFLTFWLPHHPRRRQ